MDSCNVSSTDEVDQDLKSPTAAESVAKAAVEGQLECSSSNTRRSLRPLSTLVCEDIPTTGLVSSTTTHTYYESAKFQPLADYSADFNAENVELFSADEPGEVSGHAEMAGVQDDPSGSESNQNSEVLNPEASGSSTKPKGDEFDENQETNVIDLTLDSDDEVNSDTQKAFVGPSDLTNKEGSVEWMNPSGQIVLIPSQEDIQPTAGNEALDMTLSTLEPTDGQTEAVDLTLKMVAPSQGQQTDAGGSSLTSIASSKRKEGEKRKNRTMRKESSMTLPP